MIRVILGGLLLSITHALIPNHWFPIATVSVTEKWLRAETIRITALIGFLHTLSTIVIGIIIGFVGYKLGDEIELIASIYAPTILIGLGLIFIIRNFKKSTHHTHCHINPDEISKASKKSRTAIITALGTMMFFSPCIEIEAYYFSISDTGWLGIITLSAIYLIVTVLVMVIVVDLGRKSLDYLNKKLHFLEHYEKAISGIILILLGIISLFIKF
jgi:nickel/cobalt transporter (NicO) family protein